MTIKDLQNYVLLTEQRIEDKIKSRSRYWLIAAGVALVLIVILFITVLKPKKTTDDAYEGQLNALDSLVKYQQGKIETLERYNELLDSNIQTLNEKYKANRPTETRIIHEYERIPIDINSLNREQLRREVTNY